MSKVRRCSLGCGLLALSAVVVPAAQPELRAIAEGIYVALQPEAGRFNDSNAVVLVDERGVVVVDSQASEAWTRGVIAAIRKLTDQPVRYLVNTHWHSDHTLGNRLYREAFPDVEIVAHRSVAEDLTERAEPQLRKDIERYERGIAAADERLENGVDEEGAPLDDEGRQQLAAAIERARTRLDELRSGRFVPPTVVFDRELTLRRPGREIRLLHFRGHTRGDVVVHLPREGILLTGDLVDALPYGGHGYPRSWIEELDRLENLSFEVLVPGHGGVFRGKEQIRLVRRLLQRAVDGAEAAVAAGRTLDRLQEQLDWSDLHEALVGEDEVAGRAFDAFVPDLVERAFDEASGKIDGNEGS